MPEAGRSDPSLGQRAGPTAPLDAKTPAARCRSLAGGARGRAGGVLVRSACRRTYDLQSTANLVGDKSRRKRSG